MSEDSKAKKTTKNATNNVIENSPGHQRDAVLYGNDECTVFDHKVLWLLFYGTVKSLPQSRGSFYSNKDDCITRLCPRTSHTWFLY